MMKDYDHSLAVQTKNGIYVGFREEKYNTVNFRNVQFGVADRWQLARFPETAPDEVFMADKFGPAPIQEAEKWGSLTLGGMDEQCLNMNIYTKDLTGSKKAVMVWVFPGMQIIGSNQGSIDVGNHHGKSFDASGLVADNDDIIVVVPNYRVGVFGSANLTVLPDYDPAKYAASNNLARTDILHALKWIHENIESFGGDPDNVMLFGQSAGANNITAMLLMEEAHPYFHRAAVESSFIYDISATTWEDSLTISREYFKTLGVNSIEEALTKTSDEILAAQTEMNSRSVDGSSAFANIQSKAFSPVIDDVVIHSDYWKRLMENKDSNIQVLMGTTQGEYDQQFTRWANDPDCVEKARTFVTKQVWGKLDPERGTHPEVMDEYLSHYQDERTEFEALKDMKADYFLRVGAMAYSRVLCQFTDVYLYYFAYNFYPGTPDRAPHGSEVSLLFKNDVGVPESFQQAVAQAWVNFARTGNPNNPYLKAEWKPYDTEHNYTLVLSEEPELVEGVHMDDIRTIIPTTVEYQQYPEYRKLWEK